MTLSCTFDRDLLIIDTEATGVKDYHVICQWGSVRLDRHTLQPKSRLDTIVRCDSSDIIRADPRAMEIHGITPARLTSFGEGIIEFSELVETKIYEAHGDPSEYHIYGCGVNFDIRKLDQMCKRYKVEYPFPGDRDKSGCRIYDLTSWWSTISGALGLGWGTCALRQMAKKFNIETSELHGAVDDCDITAAALRKSIELVQTRLDYTSPVLPNPCPTCDRPMILRTNNNNGSKFWGCSGFPNCRKTQRA